MYNVRVRRISKQTVFIIDSFSFNSMAIIPIMPILLLYIMHIAIIHYAYFDEDSFVELVKDWRSSVAHRIAKIRRFTTDSTPRC